MSSVLLGARRAQGEITMKHSATFQTKTQARLPKDNTSRHLTP